MIGDGVWTTRRERNKRVYQPRYRRACLGELIQIDGCDHHWFEGRGPRCTALVYIDDATGRLMELYFARSESTFHYFEATRSYLKRHGKSVAFYSDKASLFRVNAKDAKAGDGYTQFGRAMFQLNNNICANSAPAKGRVERAHQTLQDRLVKELRFRETNDGKVSSSTRGTPCPLESSRKTVASPRGPSSRTTNRDFTALKLVCPLQSGDGRHDYARL